MGSVISIIKNIFVPQKPIKVYKENVCGICIESLTPDALNDNSSLKVLICGHTYHRSCIDEWLRIGSTCPRCKFVVIQKLFNISLNVRQWIAKGLLYPLVGGWSYAWIHTIPYLTTFPLLFTTSFVFSGFIIVLGCFYSVTYHYLVE